MDPYEMGMAGSATENAIEAAVALILSEDPRYFRVPDLPFKARVGNVIRLTFAARGRAGSFGPAYGRYAAILGITSSPTPGAFTVKPIRTTRSSAPRKASAASWRAMPLRNFGPTLRGTSFADITNTGSRGPYF